MGTMTSVQAHPCKGKTIIRSCWSLLYRELFLPRAEPCPLSGVKRTSAKGGWMSAF